MTLSDRAFSDRVPNHVDFARIQIDNGGLIEHFFTAAAPRFELPRSGRKHRAAKRFHHALCGARALHVTRSADILCLTLALLLLVRRRRDLILALGCARRRITAWPSCFSVFNLAAPRFASDQGLSGLLLLVAAATAVVLSLPRTRERGAWALGAGALVLAVPALFFHGAAAAFAVLGMGLLAVSVPFLPGRDDSRATSPFDRALCVRAAG